MAKFCKICGNPNKSGLAKTCSPKCALELVRWEAQEGRRKAFRRKTRRDREKLKTRSDWLKEAQAAFNAYIRERDAEQMCVSCQKPCKKRNAGHYRSVGSAPELRFEELNCHLQCEHCNSYLSGNLIEYRKNLIHKIGQEKLDWLEGPHEPKKYTIEQLKEIKAKYKQMTREAKKD